MPERQDKDFHWQQTRQHATDISELKSSQARLEVGLANLENQVQAGFQTLQTTLSERTKHHPTPWLGIAGLTCSLVILLGTTLAFVFDVITTNMQREIDMRFLASGQTTTAIIARIEKDDELARKNAYGQGLRDAKLEALHLSVEQLRITP